MDAAYSGSEARRPVQVRLGFQESGSFWQARNGRTRTRRSRRRRSCREGSSTNFAPRAEWYREKERCVFCDIVKQEERQTKRIVDTQGDYVALCPYASRVPFEIWIMDRKHNYLFEARRADSNRRNLATLLRRVLRRLRQVAPAYHLVVHTSPNTIHKKSETPGYWSTIAQDYHWHIEIMPIVETRSKSYSIKEIYFNAMLPEQAAEHLRQLDPK